MGERASRKILRHRLEKQLARQQEDKRKELLKKRIEIAKEGVALYQRGQVIASVRKYSQYLLICEMWKKCGKGGLTPDQFDHKKDLFELVLISGIYWDFSKLYDKSKKGEQRSDLKVYLNKYVAFSKGFPYQPLSKEALRRYINSGKCQHLDEFKLAYKQLGGGKCFIAHALLDEMPFSDLSTLQNFRDLILRRSVNGRKFTAWYYRHSPRVARWIEPAPRWLKKSLVICLLSPIVATARVFLKRALLK
jgi:hypothetical protein